MKQLFFLLLLLLVTIVTFGQTDSTTITLGYSEGTPVLDILKNNMWALIAFAWIIVTTWLAESGKIKSGSILSLVINFVGKFILGKADIVKTKKANFMTEKELDKASTVRTAREVKKEEKKKKFAQSGKIILFALVLSGIGIAANAQSWQGFFKPVSINPQAKAMSERAGPTSVWLFRPTVEISAVQLVWNKTSKQFDATSLNSAGLGIGYQHFIDNEGVPYNNYGFNGLILFDIIPTETTSMSISGAVTVSVFQFVNAGVGFNFGLKTPFLLTGATVKF